MYVSCCDYLTAGGYDLQQAIVKNYFFPNLTTNPYCINQFLLLNNRSLNKLTERNFSRKTVVPVYSYRLGTS